MKYGLEEDQSTPGLVAPHAVIHLNGKTFIIAASDTKSNLVI